MQFVKMHRMHQILALNGNLATANLCIPINADELVLATDRPPQSMQRWETSNANYEIASNTPNPCAGWTPWVLPTIPAYPETSPLRNFAFPFM